MGKKRPSKMDKGMFCELNDHTDKGWKMISESLNVWLIWYNKIDMLNIERSTKKNKNFLSYILLKRASKKRDGKNIIIKLGLAKMESIAVENAKIKNLRAFTSIASIIKTVVSSANGFTIHIVILCQMLGEPLPGYII